MLVRNRSSTEENIKTADGSTGSSGNGGSNGPAAGLKSTKAQGSKPGYRRHFRQVAKPHPYSILDSPEWKQSQFFGFYVLFWVVVFVIHFRILLLNYVETGTILQRNIVDTLLSNLWHVALVDLVMYLLMYPVYFSQKLVAAGYLNWTKYGWILQHLYQAAYLGLFVFYARYYDFTWIAQIFLTLHALVQMMKMHSFAVFNGFMKRLQLDVAKKETAKTELEREFLVEMRDELQKYPKNLTLKNFFMYTMFPTVVYEMEYPRTDRIRWRYALGKILATLGVFLVMIIIAQQSMHPVAVHANTLRQSESLSFRIKRYPIIFLEVFPPFIMLYILTFYIIWDAILNSIAELTMYGDREFYRDWWNSTTWAKFARDWNVPVHDFLQRHVYKSSMLFLNLSSSQALFFTFFFSSLVHELAMFVIFGRVRGYLLLMQLTQLPMQFLSGFKFFKDRPTIGLVMFWFGIALGPSILCSLYLTF